MQPAFALQMNASLRIEPSEVSIDLFYSGTNLRATGVSRSNGDLIILCTGEEGTVELKEKKRIGGVLWINGEDITFNNVPSLYQLASSGKLSNLAGKPELIYAGMGFPALEARIVPQSDDDRQRRCFSELIKLKEKEGLYSVSEGGLELRPLGEDWKEFSTTFYFPPGAGPGTYRFRLMSFVNGKEMELAEGKVAIRLAGAAAFIRSLSLKHGLVYGVFSVVIALAAGLLTGAIFTRRSRGLGH
jgi:uncharacterized protein (TIGR02186 family)